MKLSPDDCWCCGNLHEPSRERRQERSTRVWQAVQCWALMCCTDAKEAQWATKTRECPELTKYSVHGRWAVRNDSGWCP